MTLITMPQEPYAVSAQWRLTQPSQTNKSEWTGSRQTLASNRGWWECNYSLPAIVGDVNFEPWAAFLVEAEGSVNDFYVTAKAKPQSTLSGYTVRVNGAGQTGRTIDTDGWPPNRTVLRKGQLLTFKAIDQMVRLTADVVSDGAGEATVSFNAPVRVAPADNEEIEWKRPYVKMYMVEQPFYSEEAGEVHTLSFTLMESF